MNSVPKLFESVHCAAGHGIPGLLPVADGMRQVERSERLRVTRGCPVMLLADSKAHDRSEVGNRDRHIGTRVCRNHAC